MRREIQYLDHCRPEQPVSDLEAPSKLLQDGAIWHILILLPHDSIMEVGVKYAALPTAGFHAHAAENVHHLLVQALIRRAHTNMSLQLATGHQRLMPTVSTVCEQCRLCPAWQLQ